MLQSQIIGNLGQDAQIHQNNGTSAYLQFSVGVNRKRGDTEETYWVTVFSYQTNLEKYLTKGTKVYVSGDLRPRIYTRKMTNEPKVGLSIQANTIQLLGSPRQEQAATPPPPPVAAPQAATPPAKPGAVTVEEDDLPF